MERLDLNKREPKKEVGLEKKNWAWRTMRNMVLGGMLAVGAYEGTTEILKPVMMEAKITDNVPQTGTSSENVKKQITLKMGDSVYRTEIDTGVPINQMASGVDSYTTKPLPFASAETYVTDRTGKTTAIKFEATRKGLKMIQQQLDSNGRILNEEVSYLTPEKPNIFEEKGLSRP